MKRKSTYLQKNPVSAMVMFATSSSSLSTSILISPCQRGACLSFSTTLSRAVPSSSRSISPLPTLFRLPPELLLPLLLAPSAGESRALEAA